MREKLSVIIAVYNEEENVCPLASAIHSALLHSGMEYEVIFIDDGSTDKTKERLYSISDQQTTIIELRRNYGQTAALKAGLDHASGHFIATLDGDLQNDPQDLIMMIDLIMNNSYDIVTGIRASRKDGFLLRKLPSMIANNFVRQVTGSNIIDNGCGIKVFRADVFKGIPLYGEMHRFLVSMAVLDGAKVKQVNVRHHPRIHGKSKYGLGRTLKVLSDLLLIKFLRKYEYKPMYLFGSTGIITSFAGTMILLWLLFDKINGHEIWGRPIMFLGVLLLFTGFQIISTGLILDMIVRKHFENNFARPYRIRNIKHAGKFTEK